MYLSVMPTIAQTLPFAGFSLRTRPPTSRSSAEGNGVRYASGRLPMGLFARNNRRKPMFDFSSTFGSVIGTLVEALAGQFVAMILGLFGGLGA